MIPTVVGTYQSTLRANWMMWFVAFASLLLTIYLLISGNLNVLLALIAVATIAIAYIRSKQTVILLIMVYLNLLGDIRRVADMATGRPAQDFLLLVGPAVTVLLAAPLLFRPKLDDGVSKAMFALMILMVCEIFNPRQGGLSVGLGGAFFYLVPVLWFWIGRRYGTPAFVEKFLYSILFPLGLLAALLGFYQTYVGFLPWEKAWIDAVKNTFVILRIGGSASRAFGYSTSPSEYATLLGLVAAGTAAALFGQRRIWALGFPICATAMFLASGRTAVFRLALALAMTFIFRNRQKFSSFALIRLILLILVGVFGISAAASRFLPKESEDANKQTAAEAAIRHQTEGLANPFDREHSTASSHLDMLQYGIFEGFRYPIGHGLGASTSASGKFGVSSDSGSTEYDLSDVFLDLGFVGGLLYGYVIFETVRACFRGLYLIHLRVSLVVLAVLIFDIGGWLVGGQYSTAAMMFFLMGSVSRLLVYQKSPSAKAPSSMPSTSGSAYSNLDFRARMGASKSL